MPKSHPRASAFGIVEIGKLLPNPLLELRDTIDAHIIHMSDSNLYSKFDFDGLVGDLGRVSISDEVSSVVPRILKKKKVSEDQIVPILDVPTLDIMLPKPFIKFVDRLRILRAQNGNCKPSLWITNDQCKMAIALELLSFSLIGNVEIFNELLKSLISM